MQESIQVMAMLVGPEGKYVGNLGVLEFPHVPRLGEHVLAHPNQEAPASGIDEAHLYEIVEIRYHVNRIPAGKNFRPLVGWDIAVKDLGGYLGVKIGASD